MADVLELGKPKTHSNGYFPTKPVSQLHEFYLTGEITSADDYVEWFDAIRHASETDIVKIYINSYGGDLFTAIQFMRVMAETSAHIVCSVEGACMSAATMVFLCADNFEVTPHSIFMFHNYSGGTIGKGGEMIDQLQHERKWSERLMKEIYHGFLTDEEIKAMMENKDFWMDGEEVVKRLQARMEIVQKTEDGVKTPAKKKPIAKKASPAKKAPVKKPTRRAIYKN